MATGIITVALMDQAPATITQTVSRVIQASVQQPVADPDKGSQPVAAAVAVPLQTPPPAPEKELDLSEVVQHFLPSVVRLYDTGVAGSFLGFGVLLDAQGTIVADGEILGSAKQSTIIKLADGTTYKTSVSARDAKNSLIFFTGAATTTPPQYAPTTLAKKAVSIGQSVVGIVGKESVRIVAGVVVTSATDDAPIIMTDINPLLIERGTPIIDKSGALVGISTASSRLTEGSAFIPASIIAAQYEVALMKKAKAEP